MGPMINCREFEAFIIDYLEGDLPWAKRALFNMHLAMCAECRRYLKAYQDARAIGRAVLTATDGSIPDDVPKDLINAVIAARNAPDQEA